MDKREASALADVAKTSARTIDGVDVEFGKSLCWLDNGRHERLAIMRQGATMRRVGGVLTLPAAGWFIHGAVLNTGLVIFGMNALVATVFSLPNLSAQGIFPDRAIQMLALVPPWRLRASFYGSGRAPDVVDAERTTIVPELLRNAQQKQGNMRRRPWRQQTKPSWWRFSSLRKAAVTLVPIAVALCHDVRLEMRR